MVGRVFPRYGAARAGIKAGDVITSMAGEPVRSVKDLTAIISRQEPDSTVEVTYVRDGEEKTVAVLLRGI